LDSVSAILRKLATEAKQGNINIMELSQFIAAVMPHCLHSGKFHELFPIWEQHGFHATPVHFYQPIPDTPELPETLWKQPSDFLRKGFPGLQSSIEKKIQDIDLKFFSQLQSGDILFIDSSHTVKIGGDVNYLFLEVLPRLKPGVIVHVHDIFLPFEYRRDWVMNEFRFWSEQYLLQAFLTFNSEFEVLMANRYLAHRYLEDLKAAFRNLPSCAVGSFWMRRKP